jgi:S-formylglutathione hydrolase FrmB
MREVIPEAVRRLHADPRRIAIGGISMGGFGAFDLARLNPGRFCAVGGHSPALWQTAGETASGAFDDADDFARHDVIADARLHPDRFAGERLWIDSGTEDPFVPGIRAFVAALRTNGLRISTHSWPGGHEGAYWRRHWDAYLGFYADALAACRRERA